VKNNTKQRHITTLTTESGFPANFSSLPTREQQTLTLLVALMNHMVIYTTACKVRWDKSSNVVCGEPL